MIVERDLTLDNGIKLKLGFSFSHINPTFYIKDSYKINNKQVMREVLNNVHNLSEYKKLKGYGYTRELKSEFREWRAHNFFYKLHIFRSHSKTTDFEQNESILRRFVYYMLTIF